MQRVEGKGRSIVYFDEVATSKAFSARSIRRHSSAAGGDAEASIPTAISIVNSSPHSATEEPQEQESDDVSMAVEDGDEIGNKTLKRREVVESYFDAASIIDINNHLRQGGLALETACRTQSCMPCYFNCSWHG